MNVDESNIEMETNDEVEEKVENHEQNIEGEIGSD